MTRSTKISPRSTNLKPQIDEEDAELARLEEQNAERLKELDAARRQRGRVLANLEKESSNRSATLKRLQQQQAQLEKLLKDLSRAIESAPYRSQRCLRASCAASSPGRFPGVSKPASATQLPAD